MDRIEFNGAPESLRTPTEGTSVKTRKLQPLIAALLFVFLASAVQAQPKIVVRRVSNGVDVGGGIDMGSTPVGTPIDVSFRIFNEGTQPLILGAPPVSIPVTDLYVVWVSPPVNHLDPGWSTDFTVRFLALVPGSSGATVKILSNDSRYPGGYTFMVIGQALGSGFDVVSGDGIRVRNNGTYTYPVTSPGVAVTRGFTITNSGNIPLTISNFVLSSAGGFTIVATPPGSIDPGLTGSFRIKLLSNTPGSFSGTVTLNTNVYSLPAYRMVLQGTVGSPEIRVVSGDGVNLSVGSLYVMPSTTVSVSTSRLFNLCNDGNAPLVINNPSSLVSGAGYSLIAQPATPVDPGTCTTFRVRLLAATAGVYNGAVSIQNNDADENPFTFSLRGTVSP